MKVFNMTLANVITIGRILLVPIFLVVLLTEMENKEIIEFDMDGEPVYVEVERTGLGAQRVSRGRGEDGVAKAEKRFADAIARIRPAADALLNSFKEMNTPDEIGLDFGIKFNAKAGAVFASVDSEATFKVSLKWKNVKETGKEG